MDVDDCVQGIRSETPALAPTPSPTNEDGEARVQTAVVRLPAAVRVADLTDDSQERFELPAYD